LATEDVVSHVTGQYGAGRCQKGDFSWEFDNATEDANKELIPELKAALSNYKSTFVDFYPQPTAINNIDADKAYKNTDIFVTPAGQRVDSSYKGMVISGNKKVIR
jgi:hypothetical protein